MKIERLFAMVALSYAVFSGNAAAQVAVLPSGNVGVGTNTPAYRFDVNGDALIEAQYKLMFNNAKKYVGTCYGNDFGLVSKDSTWLRIGSGFGIGFWGQAGAESNNVPTNMFISQYGVGVGNNAQAWNGVSFFLQGNGWVNGTFAWSSDERLKKDIKPIEKALDKVLRLKGTSYEYRSEETAGQKRSERRNLGFVAQQVGEVLPETVTQDNRGAYGIDYIAMIPLLVEAIKEQNKTIEAQQLELKSLRDQVSRVSEVTPPKR